MKVEPNQSVDTSFECVMCHQGSVLLPDGTTTPKAELVATDSAFRAFCRRWDPNKTFLLAYVPTEGDKETFFIARRVAQEEGLHMQAPVEPSELCWERWSDYLAYWQERPTATASA
jgi:hypothetical protein